MFSAQAIDPHVREDYTPFTASANYTASACVYRLTSITDRRKNIWNGIGGMCLGGEGVVFEWLF